MIRRIVLLAALPLALAACGDDPVVEPAVEESGGDAQGDVRGGSISDAMLPLDSVESQSPTQGGDDEDGEEGAGEGEDAGED
ncbi:hypothetical protein [Parerythrobacter jejuensis]|uniref:Uncharacterized protein n=1 Tax=Parerythrobacter jejuensis TaxID=795812 RepID=A0A845APU5_9SPHN|nr:hypothetical protein [Parerythrobacter jejuensis]MXP31459.1 hypothetical protein [Parerythrobacter jejuensis]